MIKYAHKSMNIWNYVFYFLGVLYYYVQKMVLDLISFMYTNAYYYDNIYKFATLLIHPDDEKFSHMYDDYVDVINNPPIKPEYYLTTTGTTGKPKILPFFGRIKIPSSVVLPFLRPNVWRHFTSGKTMILFNKQKIKYINDVPVTNGATKQLMRIQESKIGRYMFKYMSTTPLEYYDLDNLDDIYDLHLIFGLRERNLTVIFGYFNRSVLNLMDKIIHNWGRYVMLLNQGCFKTPTQTIYFKPEHKRASEIADIMIKARADNYKNFMKQLWNNLGLIICGSGGCFEIYQIRLNYYSDTTPVFSPYYATTEMIIGINLGKLNEQTYTLDRRLGTIITVPYGDPDSQYYTLLINSNDGLLRYEIEDLIKKNNDYTVSYCGRKDEMLCIHGVAVVDPHMLIKTLHGYFHEKIIDFVFEVVSNKIILYLELEPFAILDQNASETIDQEFIRCSKMYKRGREFLSIEQLIIKQLHSDCFKELFDYYKTKVSNIYQFKLPRLLTPETDYNIRHTIDRNIKT